MYNDQIIGRLYVRYFETYGFARDQLVINPLLMNEFANEYRVLTQHNVEPIDLSKHILNLGKSGKLPRLMRNYNGRQVNNHS